jgi:hypothetical protein
MNSKAVLAIAACGLIAMACGPRADRSDASGMLAREPYSDGEELIVHRIDHETEASSHVDQDLIMYIGTRDGGPSIAMRCWRFAPPMLKWTLQLEPVQESPATQEDSGKDRSGELPPFPKETPPISASRETILKALSLTLQTLRQSYGEPEVTTICLSPLWMPVEFRNEFVDRVREQMRARASHVVTFSCDPVLREMVRQAYRQMDYVQAIAEKLREEGLSLSLRDLHTNEHSCVDVAFEDMTLSEIAQAPDAGLELRIAECFLSPE